MFGMFCMQPKAQPGRHGTDNPKSTNQWWDTLASLHQHQAQSRLGNVQRNSNTVHVYPKP